MSTYHVRLLVTLATLTVLAAAQSAVKSPPPAPSKISQEQKASPKKPVDGHLARVETLTISSETVNSISTSLRCDSDSNIYLTTDFEEGWTVHKVNAKGERVAVYDPSSNPDLKIDFAASFALDPEGGDLYQLVMPHVIDRYVLIYKSDGTFKSAIKLNPGFVFVPNRLAVFPSGQLLIAGSEYDADKNGTMWPFSGIFAADGAMVKELELGDEKELRDMAVAADPRVASPGIPGSNKAVGNTVIEVGNDGNAYLMRWTNPVLFYAISAGGEVVRRFKVDPGEDGYRPMGMHIYRNRIAVWFDQMHTHDKIMKIVDLEGHVLATYDELKVNVEPKHPLGLAFACYTENPTRFLFLGSDDGNKVQLQIAEPR